MAIRMPHIVGAKKVPKGHFADYVGENQKRFVIPLSFLNQSLFQNLLGLSEEEFGYSHPTGGLRIPCEEDIFLDVTSLELISICERINKKQAYTNFVEQTKNAM